MPIRVFSRDVVPAVHERRSRHMAPPLANARDRECRSAAGLLRFWLERICVHAECDRQEIGLESTAGTDVQRGQRVVREQAREAPRANRLVTDVEGMVTGTAGSAISDTPLLSAEQRLHAKIDSRNEVRHPGMNKRHYDALL